MLALAGSIPAVAKSDCAALHQQQQQLATEAMRAEMALVLATRRRLCPRVEAQAEQPMTAEKDTHQSLKFDAYIRCRANTEALLKRTHPVLYTNRKGFIFYTAEGARLARKADALAQDCRPPASPIPELEQKPGQNPAQREKSAS